MDVNASIIDQQLNGILEKHAEALGFLGNDNNKKRSSAFTVLSMAKEVSHASLK